VGERRNLILAFAGHLAWSTDFTHTSPQQENNQEDAKCFFTG
jgi:hypothetical protein